MPQSEKSAARPFERSIALFDRDSRLVEWDAGFEAEFAAARALIAPGAPLGDLLDATGRRLTERHAGSSPGSNASEESDVWYQNGAGGTVRVRKTPTPSGGFVRTAWTAGVDQAIGAAFESAEERWRTDGDPNAEVFYIFRVKPNGSPDFPPYGDDARALFGFSDDADMSFASVHARMVISKEESQQVRAAVADLSRYLLPASTELRIRGSDGRLIWTRQSMTPSREADGSTRVLMRIRDITREKLAEDQLELLRSAVASVTDSIRIVHTQADGRSHTLYVNPAHERMSGVPAHETVGKPLDPGDERRAAGWTKLLAMAEKGDGSSVEFEGVNRNGRSYWVESSATLIDRRPDGSLRWAALSRNIEERRRVQRELLEAKEAAEAANRAKSEFLANMSHEIRTPMNGVLGMVSLLHNTPLSSQQRQYARAIEVSGDALLSIINDILDISKLEAGRLELESIDFDLAGAVESAVTLISGRAETKGVGLAVEIDPAAELTLRGDPNRIRQVLLNLLGNGIKFTHSGLVSLRVGVAAAERDGMAGPVVRFEVADTGIGVSAEAQERLFQKFSQADSSITRRFGGTGLGLAICKQLVELMCGRIGAESAPGQGSTFWFEIPLVSGRTALPQARSAEANSRDTGERVPSSRDRAAAHGEAAAAPAGLRVLLAEDHKINQQFALAVLAAAGHRADLANNGHEAVEAVRTCDYDVILMDVHMPESDGIEATRRIRGMPPPKCNVPIIALTADAMSGSKEEYLAAGMDAYLSKPVKAADLLAMLAQVRGGGVGEQKRPSGQRMQRRAASAARRR
jgi:PAS domain S-box-containing protein